MSSDALSRHECMIYEGSPWRTLPSLVGAIARRLEANTRCMFVNSPAMVAGLQSRLYAAGIDVAIELARGRLLLESSSAHLVDGRFEIDRMIDSLETAASQAVTDGYTGLFATGDMTWEFGPEKDFSKLLEYEWQLEQLFRRQPALSGICQYHCDLLPRDAVRVGMVSHANVFLSETLSRLNPSYVPAETIRERDAAARSVLDEAIAALLAASA